MGCAHPPGDRVRMVGWNCNSLGKYASQVKFINKIRKMEGDIFVLCDTRLSPSDEGSFRKIWGETVLFNSQSGDRRGIAVLIRDGTPIENIEFQNIIRDIFLNLPLM